MATSKNSRGTGTTVVGDELPEAVELGTGEQTLSIDGVESETGTGAVSPEPINYTTLLTKIVETIYFSVNNKGTPAPVEVMGRFTHMPESGYFISDIGIGIKISYADIDVPTVKFDDHSTKEL